ncbi:MAG TPA: lysine--tRNA ligase [Polyangiaceae bacterium]|nr:lysine--tRNA ligase [Polyangiaceae bacterium]
MTKSRDNGNTLGAEEAIIAARAAKAEAIRARGENPFANDLSPAPLVGLGDLRARFASAKQEGAKYEPEAVKGLAGGRSVHVAGRVIAVRGFGKATFIRLRDGQGEMQLFCRSDSLGDAFARLGEIEVADFVEAEGLPMVTKTGELSIEASSIRMLTKAMRPLPEKWHGLTDVELRYRHRYVDLVANTEVKELFVARSLVVRELRRYLDDLGYLEVETPTMHTVIGGATAKPFVTHHNTLDMRLFMRIAPELYLKRLVVGGLDRVYEFARCYRNEGISTKHNPEFTLLEAYCAYATYETLQNLVEDMLRTVDDKLARAMPEPHARWSAARTFTLAEPFARVPMKIAVLSALERAGLPSDVPQEIRKGTSRIKEWAQKSARAKSVDWSNFHKAMAKAKSDGEALFLAYEFLAEPFYAEDYRSADGSKSLPVFTVDYPYEVSPLSRKKDADPTLVDRFELFVNRMEVCNAFSELNDPADQAARFRDQVERKAGGDEEAMDYDEDYIRALEHGLPPTAGLGMGIERLVMTLTAQPSIREVILFPLLRSEKPVAT